MTVIAALTATMLAQGPPSANSALALCRPALARKANGDIAELNIERSVVRGNATTVTGRITVFVGMGAPVAGSASAHHLIRAQYGYRCVVRSGKVRTTTLSQ
jgi:hypothetical protein